MLRRLSTLLGAASLLLCVAACVLWVRSYHRTDVLAYTAGDRWRAVSGGGGVFLDAFRFTHRVGPWNKPPLSPDAPLAQYTETEMAFLDWRKATGMGTPRAGWGFETDPTGDPWGRIAPCWVPPPWPAVRDVAVQPKARWHDDRETAEEWWFAGTQVWLPCWVLFVVAAAPPAVWLRAVVRPSRRSAPNRCAACGYDLRATPGRCPECGAVPDAGALPEAT